MQYTPDIRPCLIDLCMNRPFAYGAMFTCGSVHTLTVEVDDDQVLRLQSPPADRPRFDENEFLVEPGAQMTTQTVSRSFDGVENSACLNQPFTKCRFRVHLDLGLHQLPRAFIELDIPLQEQGGGTNPVDVAILGGERFVPLCEPPDLLEQQAAHGDNCRVARAQAFSRPVDDGRHAFLNRLILGSKAVDAGHRGRPLLFAVYHVIIYLIADGLEGTGSTRACTK